VLAVTALGRHAGRSAGAGLPAVDAIDFADGFHRRDIGWRELERVGMNRHGPLGAAAEFEARSSAGARNLLDYYELPQVTARWTTSRSPAG
jgi:phosphoribosylamine-glycine ligase